MGDPLSQQAVEYLARHAAGWIYRKRHGVGWWSPLVLTAHNPDVSNIRLNPEEAVGVFLLFEERGFFKRYGQVVTKAPDTTNLIYTFDESKIEEFKKFSDLPWIFVQTPEWVFTIWRKFPGLLTAAGILIATEFFKSFFGKFGEAFFVWLQRLLE